MTVTIVPFAPEHLEAAAALLASRHQRDRIQHPALPPRFEDAAATRAALQEVAARTGTTGVAALRGEHLAGFMLGAPELPASTEAMGGFMRPRSAEILYEGHAIGQEDGGVIAQKLYAALAARWVADGLVAHYVNAPADRDADDIWADLGFGRVADLALRDPIAPAGGDPGRETDLHFRRATADDEAVVQGLVAGLLHSFADPPIFTPFLPEGAAARAQFAAELLADPTSPIWLACRDGQVAGMQLFLEPASPHWFVSPMRTPERCIYLMMAFTMPEARGSGIGAALVTHTMAWARDAGYDRCAVHYMTASRAARFWRGLGFQPVSHFLCRVVDERVAWAHGRLEGANLHA